MKRPGAKESSAKSLSFSPAHYEWSVNEEGHARMANKAAVAFEWQRFLVRDSGGGGKREKKWATAPPGPHASALLLAAGLLPAHETEAPGSAAGGPPQKSGVGESGRLPQRVGRTSPRRPGGLLAGQRDGAWGSMGDPGIENSEELL